MYDFNPRSREGSDAIAEAKQKYGIISIHAPARGATKGLRPLPVPCRDFNPRSREGSDTCISSLYPFPPYFNPRSREGSDITVTELVVSRPNFNPRSREGSDF